MRVKSKRTRNSIRLLLIPALLVGFATQAACGGETVSFSRDVLPILSDRCFHCHGPDESHREADLRLDVREWAVGDGDYVIVPGEPDQSELIARVADSDGDSLMPPPDSHREPLSEAEIETLRQWIAEGAPWGSHWAFEPPRRPELSGDERNGHPVDALVARRHAAAGAAFSPPAPLHTQVRRLSFALTGLPPTLDDVDAFVADPSQQAYEELVDRLLDSPHYGERMAMWWLDGARYSDTDGYQQDATRNNWPWRDWVIDAFNNNMPFDEFTRMQFAGDLLPDASPEQILATCFHRNHMTNGEGGRDPEESRVDYVIDRINTVGTLWLGMTLGCAQCHTHKFDPISHREYYSLAAFFDSIDEDGKAGNAAKPYLKYRSPYAAAAVEEAEAVAAQRRKVEKSARQAAEAEFDPWLHEQISRLRGEGFTAWHPLQAAALTSTEGSELAQDDGGSITASGPNPNQDDYRIVAPAGLQRITGLRLEVFLGESGKVSRGESGEFILTNVKLQVQQRGVSQLRDIEIASAVADVQREVSGRNYGKVQDTLDDDPRNGWTIDSDAATQPHTAVFALAEPIEIAEDESLVFMMFHRSTEGDANIAKFRVSVTDQPGKAVRSLEPMPLEALADHVGKLADSDADLPEIEKPLRRRLLDQFLEDHSEYQRAKRHLDRAERQLSQVKKAAGELNVMVLAERSEPRQTHVLLRGVWDQKGEAVTPGVPEAISPPPVGPVTNRLELAEWLVADDHPLTARVLANHLWQIAFAEGLVRTPEDFGLQGDPPTHPELLDWLAVELVESGWDIKHLLRLIVTSDTYRQSSELTPKLRELDPENRLLARAPRYRLPSWMIRDAALHAAGLLNPTIGGPPVMPYQPESAWSELFMGRFQYEPSQGPVQFRRTIYAFWRRSVAPTFLFDSAQRRTCEVRSPATNTPLQALTLLNDPNQLEAARGLAQRAIKEADEPAERRALLWRFVLSRSPSDEERRILAGKLQRAEEHYRAAPEDARLLLDFGQPELQACDSPEECAAYLVVASMILNLDEAISHE